MSQNGNGRFCAAFKFSTVLASPYPAKKNNCASECQARELAVFLGLESVP